MPNHPKTVHGLRVAKALARDRATIEELPEMVQQELKQLRTHPNYHAIRALVLGRAMPENGILAEPVPWIADEIAPYRSLLQKPEAFDPEPPDSSKNSPLIDVLYSAMEEISNPP
ncbi:MAG TPA: hypothetical protein VJK52_06055, partial [Candidatus Nanoarchaeia archaeon]|nr:hypothetical protein [Candidatus Nanoarchaeia archaeon]